MFLTVVSIAAPIALAIAAWFVTNFVGQPILTLRDRRVTALEAANRYWAVSPLTSDETRDPAVKALFDAANALDGSSLSGSIAVRMWCRLFKYDLSFAASTLRGLAEPIRGEVSFPDEARRSTRNAVFVALNATGILSPSEITVVKRAIEQTKSGDF